MDSDFTLWYKGAKPCKEVAAVASNPTRPKSADRPEVIGNPGDRNVDVLAPGATERIVTIEMDAETLGGLFKKGYYPHYGGFTLFSDELGPNGICSAPTPTAYLAAAILF